jgi:hypothetical protein
MRIRLLLCEFARKKENPSLERYITPPYVLLVIYWPNIGMPDSRSQASRLNHRLFEVVAVAPPQVAYPCVTKNRPTLHTCDRAGHGAGTRRATQAPSSRCSCLSANASILAERFHNPSSPCAAWGCWRSRAPGFSALTRHASRVLEPRHMSPRPPWSPGENRRASDR